MQQIPYEILNAKTMNVAAITPKLAKRVLSLSPPTWLVVAPTSTGKGVRKLGGLVVIGWTPRLTPHRQPASWSGGRQGDPSTTNSLFLRRRLNVSSKANVSDVNGASRYWWRHSIQTKSISKTLESAQKRVEGFNFDSRKNVVQYDNVINRHRKVVYGMRRKILEGEDIYSEIERLINTTVSDLCQFSSRVNKRFAENFQAIFPNLDTKIIKEIGLLRKKIATS